jgi:hypothetical protein
VQVTSDGKLTAIIWTLSRMIVVGKDAGLGLRRGRRVRRHCYLGIIDQRIEHFDVDVRIDSKGILDCRGVMLPVTE